MRVALYTKIRPAEGQSEVEIIRKAHVLGYELVPFEGYTDSDIGYAGNKGPKYDESKKNLAALKEIQDACVVRIDGLEDWPHIVQSAE